MRRTLATLLAVATAALAAPALASATTVRSGSSTGSPYTGSISGTAIGDSTFDSAFVDVTCTGASFGGDITNSSGTGDIDTWTWSGCSSSLGGTCTVTAGNLSWSVTISHVNGQSWDGTFRVGGVSLTVACTGTGLGSFSCTYRGSGTGDSVTSDLYNPDNPNRPYSNSGWQVEFGDENLTRTGGSLACSSAAGWSTTYEVTGAGGAELWVTA
jgi:hypothetical protein